MAVLVFIAGLDSVARCVMIDLWRKASPVSSSLLVLKVSKTDNLGFSSFFTYRIKYDINLNYYDIMVFYLNMIIYPFDANKISMLI